MRNAVNVGINRMAVGARVNIYGHGRVLRACQDRKKQGDPEDEARNSGVHGKNSLPSLTLTIDEPQDPDSCYASRNDAHMRGRTARRSCVKSVSWRSSFRDILMTKLSQNLRLGDLLPA